MPLPARSDVSRARRPCLVLGTQVYIADGYGNSRVVVFSKEGKYLTEWGGLGTMLPVYATMAAQAFKQNCSVTFNESRPFRLGDFWQPSRRISTSGATARRRERGGSATGPGR